MSDLDSVVLFPVDLSWVKEREALLIEQENEMFRAARDRATSAEERAYWGSFNEMREANLRNWRREP